MLAYEAVALVHRLGSDLDSYYVLWEKDGRVPSNTFDRSVREKTDKLRRVGEKALRRMRRRIDRMNALAGKEKGS
jgi:hypothetical protein